MTIAALLIGGFYMFAGMALFLGAARDRLLDDAIAAITLEPTEAADKKDQHMMLGLGTLIFAGGLALASLSILAPFLFLSALTYQAIWFWRVRGNKEEEPQQKTWNAFWIFVAATAFTWLAAFSGLFVPWFGWTLAASLTAQAGAIFTVTALALVWFFFRHKLKY